MHPSRINRDYIGPAVEKARMLSSAKPLTAVSDSNSRSSESLTTKYTNALQTFLLIFSALSFFPILTFLYVPNLRC